MRLLCLCAFALCVRVCVCVCVSSHSLAAQVKYVGLMQYDGDLKLPTNYLVPPPAIHGVSGEYCAATGVKTFVCSETQKFGRACGLEAHGRGACTTYQEAHVLASALHSASQCLCVH